MCKWNQGTGGRIKCDLSHLKGKVPTKRKPGKLISNHFRQREELGEYGWGEHLQVETNAVH